MTLLEKFKELSALSTPAPWMVGGKFTVRTTLNSLDWIARMRDRHHKHDDIEDEANAKLITLSRNHIDSLVGVATAAKEYIDSEYEVTSKAYKNLCDALAKLEGEV